MEPILGMEQIRQDQEDLRARFQTLRENELFQLRQQTDSLDSKYKQAVAYVAAVILGLSALGYTKVEDVDKSMNNLVDKKLAGTQQKYEKEMEKLKEKYEKEMKKLKEDFATTSNRELVAIKKNMEELHGTLETAGNDLISFNETLQTALLENADTQGTLRELKKLARLRPMNELVFVYLTDHCLRQNKYNDAFRHLAHLEQKGISPDNFKSPMSLLNAGIFMWIKSFHETSGESVDSARRYLEKAQDPPAIEQSDDEPQSKVARRSWYYLALLHLSQNRLQEAEACASRYQELLKDKNNKENLSKDTTREWFRLLENKCGRRILPELERMFPGCYPEEKQEPDL